MASLIYTNNKWGTVSGPASSSGIVDVTFVSRVQADTVTITCLCHACGEYLIPYTFSNVSIGEAFVASFDIGGLEGSGHPGPFEFTPTASTGEVEFLVELDDNPPGAANALSGAGSYVVPHGGSLEIHIGAGNGNPGYRFVRWEIDGYQPSTYQHLTLRFSGVLHDRYIHGTAMYSTTSSLYAHAWIEIFQGIHGGTGIITNRITGEQGDDLTQHAGEGASRLEWDFLCTRTDIRYVIWGRYYRYKSLGMDWGEWTFTSSAKATGSQTSRDYETRFLFRELNKVYVNVKFFGYVHGTKLTVRVDSVDDHADERAGGDTQFGQGPVELVEDGQLSMYCTNYTLDGTTAGTKSNMGFKIEVPQGSRLVKAVVTYRSSRTERVRTFMTYDTEFKQTLYIYGNDGTNEIAVYVECDLLVYDVSGFLVYREDENGLVYAGYET